MDLRRRAAVACLLHYKHVSVSGRVGYGAVMIYESDNPACNTVCFRANSAQQ